MKLSLLGDVKQSHSCYLSCISSC